MREDEVAASGPMAHAQGWAAYRTPQLLALYAALKSQLDAGFLLEDLHAEAAVMQRGIIRQLSARGWCVNRRGEMVQHGYRDWDGGA